MVTIYLAGVAIALLLLLGAWNKYESSVHVLDICLGLLSCLTSWAAVIVLIYLLVKKI